MKTSLVLTILGPDRTGLVRAVADAVADHGGSWQESRMSRMAGQFAGILRVECPSDRQEALEKDLATLGERGLTVMIAHDVSQSEANGETLAIDITGHDEPGIMKRIASTLAGLGVNVEELHTSLESAPMAGHLLFCTRGKVCLPVKLGSAELIEELEKLGSDLTVDVQ
ncbi:MAG: glycine cleavage system regulatory protein [Paracoccaceae bacterium]|jgi:glycine cleavage system regulatory protein